MATSITTSIENVCMSSRLPDEINITTGASRVEVDIYMDHERLFRSVYYPYKRSVKVRDIRLVVEAYMIEKKLTVGSFTMEVYEPMDSSKPASITYDENGDIEVDFGSDEQEADAIVTGKKIVFCSCKSPYSTSSFLLSNFLTTRQSALLPRNNNFRLSNYTKAAATGTNTALIYYTTDGKPDVINRYKYTYDSVQSNIEGVVTKTLTHTHFKSLVDNGLNTDCKVLGVEYKIGSRQFGIFFTDEEPTEVFEFLSAFNIMETAYLYNTSTTKTEVERSEAVFGRQTQYFDQSVKIKHEVETAPLTYDEAMWLNQMLTSSYVTKQVKSLSIQVLISDVSSEVTDSDKDLIRLKFSWRFADGNDWIEK